MITPDQLKKIDSSFEEFSEEEILKVLASLYEQGQLIFDDWLMNKGGSKYPVGVLRKLEESNKLEL